MTTVGFSRRFEREVGATPAEFRRGLALADPGFVEQADGSLHLTLPAVRLTIRYSPQPDRRLGLFVLPVLHVIYDFESGAPEACRTLLARLDLAMQRGGG